MFRNLSYLICVITVLLLPARLFAQVERKPGPRTFQMGKYTIKQYFFVMLVKGPRRDELTDTAIINKLQAGHMANMERLSNEGKLMLAGPFGDDGDWRGIFVLDADTEDDARKLLATDPMINAGRLGYEMHPWYTAMNSVFK